MQFAPFLGHIESDVGLRIHVYMCTSWEVVIWCQCNLPPFLGHIASDVLHQAISDAQLLLWGGLMQCISSIFHIRSLILICNTLHYWLRPIEGVQFRFDNFGSHFIRVQIFQIDFSTLLLILSAFKYFRLILKRPNEHFSISFSHYHAIETFVQQLRKEKGTSWTLLNDPNIWSKQVVRRYCKTIFVIF